MYSDPPIHPPRRPVITAQRTHCRAAAQAPHTNPTNPTDRRTDPRPTTPPRSAPAQGAAAARASRTHHPNRPTNPTDRPTPNPPRAAHLPKVLRLPKYPGRVWQAVVDTSKVAPYDFLVADEVRPDPGFRVPGLGF